MPNKLNTARNLYKNTICYTSEGHDWNKDDSTHDMNLFCYNQMVFGEDDEIFKWPKPILK